MPSHDSFVLQARWHPWFIHRSSVFARILKYLLIRNQWILRRPWMDTSNLHPPSQSFGYTVTDDNGLEHMLLKQQQNWMHLDLAFGSRTFLNLSQDSLLMRIPPYKKFFRQQTKDPSAILKSALLSSVNFERPGASQPAPMTLNKLPTSTSQPWHILLPTCPLCYHTHNDFYFSCDHGVIWR